VPASRPRCPPHGAVPKVMRRPVAVVACTLLGLAGAGAASAEPLASKRAEADRVLAYVQALDARVGKAVEDYNAARIRLDEIRTKQRENRRRLAIARGSLRNAQRALQARLLALYTSDTPSSLEVLLGSTTLDDLLARAETVGRVSAQDARVVGEIRAFGAEVKRRRAELAEARAGQEDVVSELAARRREIEAELAERRRLLASIQAEIERIEAAEARRQQRLQEEARRRLASAAAAAASDSSSDAGTSSSSSSESASSGAAPPAAEAPPAVVSDVAAEAPPPPRHGGVVGIAMQYLGIPYRWGGASPSTGFDCSGFVMYVFAQVGVSLPHNAAAQYAYGAPVSRSQLQSGDVVFFNGLGHNGIYVGGGQFIHSPHTGDVVKISSLSDSWYAQTYVGARRM
jgi:cell wall-associated NlpC family hydrolase